MMNNFQCFYLCHYNVFPKNQIFNFFRSCLPSSLIAISPFSMTDCARFCLILSVELEYCIISWRLLSRQKPSTEPIQTQGFGLVWVRTKTELNENPHPGWFTLNAVVVIGVVIASSSCRPNVFLCFFNIYLI